jgi:hypothetical protein
MLKNKAPPTPIIEVITLIWRRTLRISRNRFHVNGSAAGVVADDAAAVVGDAVVDAVRTCRVRFCANVVLRQISRGRFGAASIIFVLLIVDCCLMGFVNVAGDRDAFGVTRTVLHDRPSRRIETRCVIIVICRVWLVLVDYNLTDIVGPGAC